jgi:hypothetical protein
MAWRKWLVRSLVFTISAGLAVTAFFYQRWTDPEKVRALVLDQFGRRFAGAHVSLDTARFHLFGGIAVTDVRMARRNDPDHAEFAYVPTLTIYLDKEQLLHGRQILRKLELERPRLRVIRGADGKWNLNEILGPVDPNEPIPTIVIHHGTILVEDRMATAQSLPVEIKDVNLTIINDPILVLSFAGSGSSELGPLQFSATHQRISKETKITLEALAVPVGPALVQRLASYKPELATHARQLEGVGKLHAEFAYHPQSAREWSHDVQFQLRQGKFVHARLPMPLEQVEGSVQCIDGRVPLVHLAARAGAAYLDLSIKNLDVTRLDEDQLDQSASEIEFKAQHLMLTHDLFAALPTSLTGLRTVDRDYEPRGPTSLEFTLRRDPSRGWQKHAVVRPEDVRIEFVKFPFVVEHLTGVIEQEGATHVPDVLKVNLSARSGDRTVSIRGEIRDQTPAVAHNDRARPPSFVHVDVRAENVPVDEKLRKALLPKGESSSKMHDLAEAFQPKDGTVDVQAFIRRDGRSKQFSNNYIINFRRTTMRYKVFPYPLERVTGTLEIQPNTWEFRDFGAAHKGGAFRAHGRSFASSEGKADRAEVFLEGTNLQLDDELKAALQQDLQQAWNKLQPEGRIDFTAHIDIPPGGSKTAKPEIELSMQARGCSIKPDFFKYAFRDITGRVRYTKRWVILEDMHARHGESVWSLEDGLVYVKDSGGVWVQLGRPGAASTGIHGTPLVPDDDFLKALPECLSKAAHSLQWRDPVRLDTKLVVETQAEHGPPVVWWDGSMTFQDAYLKTGIPVTNLSGTIACLGRHDGRKLQGIVGNIAFDTATLFKQTFRSIHSRVEVTNEEPDVLKLPGFYAQFCGGEVYGPFRIELGSTIRYEMNLTASHLKLEEFARQNPSLKSELSGEATAQLYLAGRGENLEDLKGNGRIDVPKGKIENLPLLVNLLKFLALRLPDRTAFEEAHAEFEILGARAKVTRLDLFGNAISLRGQGDLRLDGTDLNLDFNADWARFPQVLPPGINKIPTAISNQLLRIKMRGDVSDPKFQKDFVPLVTDPMKKMWNEMKNELPSGRGRGGASKP